MLKDFVKSTWKNEEGSLFIYLALAIIPLLGFIGLSVDMSRAYHARALVVNATDAAAMAAAKVSSERAVAEANRVFNAYLNGTSIAGKAKIEKVEVNTELKYIQVNASTNIDMTFTKIIGYDNLDVAGESRVLTGGGVVEVAMVLDNAGSLQEFVGGSSRMNHIKGGAFLFIDSLFRGEDEPNDLFVSIVPYITQVNVGARREWLTVQGKSMVGDKNKFPKGRGEWMGCLEARLNNDLHKLDTPPTDELTRFNPFWWPSTEVDPYTYPDGTIKPWGEYAKGDNDWTTKKISPFSSSTPVSPNAGCPAQLLPLTNKDSDLSDKIRDMRSIQRGGSFIFSGLIWGLRALSPSWRDMWHDDNPHNLPLNFQDSKKVMVLVISGGNQWFGNEAPWSQYNDRHYTSFGLWYGNAHASLNQKVIMPSTMNAYTSEICESIKAKGIGLYTIAFSVQDQATLGLMKSCATDSNYYYEAQSSAEMKNIFKEIADQIRALRYSWPGNEGT